MNSKLALGISLLFPAIPLLADHPAYPGKTPVGLSEETWRSVHEAYEVAQHRFEPSDAGWTAFNSASQWTVTFDGRGFLATPRHGTWCWGLELLSYGRCGSQTKLSGTACGSASGSRLSLRRDEDLVEWFKNDARGLEQGFVIARRPRGDGSDPLVLTLATRGILRPEIGGDSSAVNYVDESGGVAVTYSGLKAWDAEGTILASHFEKTPGNAVCLVVEDAGAVYPITIDPIAQQAYLKASNTDAGDLFGIVAISGDTLVVGAPAERSNATGVNAPVSGGSGTQADNSASFAGAVYVFVRKGATWTQQAYLKASNTEAGDLFGATLDISGDTVVVGAVLEGSNATGINAPLSGGTGTQANNSFSNAGAAYVFVRNGTTWTQEAYLKASNTGSGDSFGSSVAISGDTIVIGANGEGSNARGANAPLSGGSETQADNSANGAGAAYVFVRNGTTWTQEAYLKASNTSASDRFGFSADILGDTIVIGAPSERSNATGVNAPLAGGAGGTQADNSAPDAGAAYVFKRNGTNWSQQAYLKASNTGAGDEFGGFVSISGETLVVGAQKEDSNAAGVNADLTGGSGTQADNSAPDAGAAYVFVRNGTVWSQEAYLKASNTGAGDEFGGGVSISGDTLVAGASEEDSNATGVNAALVGGSGSQSDDSASDAGAAYVFIREGTSWSQLAYLKSSNTGAGDRFGVVDIQGDTVVVGAFNEDGDATGVGAALTGGSGTQGDDSAADAGAVYIFSGLLPKLTLSNPRAFRPTLVGKRSLPQTLTLRNTGGSPAVGLSSRLTGKARREFLFSRLTSVSLAPGSTETFKVTFTPKRKGVRRAAITVGSKVSATTKGLRGTGSEP